MVLNTTDYKDVDRTIVHPRLFIGY